MSFVRLAACVLISGCTSSHVVALAPVESAHPVSASTFYVEPDGQVMTPDDDEVMAPLQFEKSARSDGVDTQNTWQLGPELDQRIRSARGGAITQLRIEATSFETHESISSILGPSLIAVGAILLIPTLKSDADSVENAWLWASAACTVAGWTLYSVGDIWKPSSWQLRVTGRIVRSLPRHAPAAVGYAPESSPLPQPALPIGDR